MGNGRSLVGKYFSSGVQTFHIDGFQACWLEYWLMLIIDLIYLYLLYFFKDGMFHKPLAHGYFAFPVNLLVSDHF